MLRDKGRTGPFTSCNLHNQVCRCMLWKERTYTISLLQHRFWHLPQQAAWCLRSGFADWSNSCWGSNICSTHEAHTLLQTSSSLIPWADLLVIRYTYLRARLFSPFINKESISHALQCEQHSNWRQLGDLLPRHTLMQTKMLRKKCPVLAVRYF